MFQKIGNLVQCDKKLYLITDENNKWQCVKSHIDMDSNILAKELIDLSGKYVLHHCCIIGCQSGGAFMQINDRFEKITVIEPDTNVCNHIHKNISLNNIYNIEVINKAIGRTEEILFTYKSEDGIVSGTEDHKLANMRGFKDYKEYDTIKSVTLDSLGFSPDIIVIDSCGFENEILYGMQNTLKYNPILLINVWSNKKRKEMKLNFMIEDVLTTIRTFDYDECDQITNTLYLFNKYLHKKRDPINTHTR